MDGDGFPRQREAISKFAKTNRYEIVGEFRDEGISGTSDLEHRPGLTALLERLESNGVHTILVERADRLARDLMVGEVILDQLKKLGAKVLTAEGDDLTTGDDDLTRTLIRQVLAAVAQFEKGCIVAKLRVARARRRAKTGRCEGVKPFGCSAPKPRCSSRSGCRTTGARRASALRPRSKPTRCRRGTAGSGTRPRSTTSCAA